MIFVLQAPIWGEVEALLAWFRMRNLFNCVRLRLRAS